MINNTKILWIAVAIIGIVSLVAFFNGRTVTQVIENPLGSITSPWTVGPEFSINELNTYVARGDFKNATTTFVFFKNPLPATSTIDLVELINTGVATSTYVAHCGITALTVGGVAPTTDILTSGDVATSTSFGTMVNNEANSFPVSGGSTARLRIGPNEYFECYATTYAVTATHDAAFTGTNNTFDGNFKVRFVR